MNEQLDWGATCYLYGGIWTVTLPDGKEVELNCNGWRGVGFRAINCFGFEAAQKAKYTLKNHDNPNHPLERHARKTAILGLRERDE